MARIVWKDWIAVEGLSNDAIKGAIKEIGAERLDLGKAGDVKARREIKSIADKWAKKFPVVAPKAEASAKAEVPPPKSGAKPKADTKAKAAAPPKSEPKPKAKAKAEVPPKSEPKPKARAKAKAPKSEPKPKVKAKAPPKSEPKPKVKAKAKAPKAKPEAAPTSEKATAPKSGPKAAPRSAPKPAPKSAPKPAPKSEKPKAKKATAKPAAAKVTAAKVKELRAALATKLSELRVSCPGERAQLVEDAAAALATARAVAMVSPEVRHARNELQAALVAFAGYKEAKAAIAAAEKSVPVREAKAHVKAVMAEQVSERELQIIEDAEKDPRVITAREALAAARSPEAVQKAMTGLASAREHCRRSARNLRETYGAQIDKLRAEMAATPLPDIAPPPAALPTAEQLLFGPRTVASARAS